MYSFITPLPCSCWPGIIWFFASFFLSTDEWRVVKDDERLLFMYRLLLSASWTHWGSSSRGRGHRSDNKVEVFLAFFDDEDDGHKEESRLTHRVRVKDMRGSLILITSVGNRDRGVGRVEALWLIALITAPCLRSLLNYWFLRRACINTASDTRWYWLATRERYNVWYFVFAEFTYPASNQKWYRGQCG